MSPTRLRPPGSGARARSRPPRFDARLRATRFDGPARIRLRPAGFDARPHRPSSLRAQAQRVFRAKAERDEVLRKPVVDRLSKDTPLPNPPPQGGREQTGVGARKQTGRGAREQTVPGVREEDSSGVVERQMTTLTRHVRALYENSVVPVAEIARLAGVHQRTLYKYVQKGGWRRRHATQDLASAVRKRAQKRKPRACVTGKGAGGRFIRGADAGKPFRRGLKALDPEGEARALRRTRRAATLSDDATSRTRRLREALSDARTLALTMQVVRDIAAIEDAGKPAVPDAACGREMSDDDLRRELARRIEAMAEGERSRQEAPRSQPQPIVPAPDQVGGKLQRGTQADRPGRGSGRLDSRVRGNDTNGSKR
jgi:hypothetical protein